MSNPRWFKKLVLPFVLAGVSRASAAYDCSKHTPFKILSQQEAAISVEHTFWDGAARKERSEPVCATSSPIKVRVLDIRGREEEWFWCEQGDLIFTCETKYRGAWARIRVRPAVVIRRNDRGVFRDTHFHAFVEPLGGASAYLDIFARSQSRDLKQTELTLDASGGGRGERSDTDSYYVRVDFAK